MSETTTPSPIKIHYEPDEMLIRWHRKSDEGIGSSLRMWEVQTVEGVGEIGAKLTDPMTPQQAAALGFPFEDVISEAHLGESIRADKAEARVAELEREKAEVAEAHAAELAALNDRIQGDALVLDGYRRDRAALVEQLSAVEADLAEAQESPFTKALNAIKGLFTKAA